MIPDRVYAHAKGSTYNIKMIAKSGLSLDSVKEKIGLYRLSYLITVFWNDIKRKTKNQKKIWEQIMQIEVQCSADPAFPKEVTDSRIIGKKKTKVVFSGLQRKTAYFVRARYLDGAGGYSAWSKVKKMKTK